MEVRVLGPVELVAEDGLVPLGAPKQRRLLSALVVHAGEARSADLLIDAIWGPSPPASAAKLLQTYVSQLRKALPAPARVRTRGRATRSSLRTSHSTRRASSGCSHRAEPPRERGTLRSQP